MASGRDSSFDTPAWLNFPQPRDSWLGNVAGAGHAQKVVMQAMVRIPRLWRLVRQVRLRPEDHTATTAAAHLGNELLGLKLEDWIDGLFSTGIVSRVEDEGLTAHLGVQVFSFKLPSIRILCLLMDYWQSRILIYGFIQVLVRYSPRNMSAVNRIDLKAIQNMDVLAASNLMACVQEMASVGRYSPVSRLRFSPSTMNAFSAWARLEAREQAQMLEDADNCAKHEAAAKVAAKMQRRCCELMVRWINFWKTSVDDDEVRCFRAQLIDHTNFMECGEVTPGLKQLKPKPSIM